MKKYILLAATLLFYCVGCDKSADDSIPADLQNLRVETRNGAIVLKWDKPTEPSVLYVQVDYTHPQTGEKRMRVASSHTDSIRIDGLLKRDGEYTFSVKPVSSTKTLGKETIISATSDPVIPVYTPFTAPIVLTEPMLSANASDSGDNGDFTGNAEGHLIRLIDGDSKTFYATAWRTSVPMPHWLQIDLTEAVEGVSFSLVTRHNFVSSPGLTEILVSNDGTTWSKIGEIADKAIPNIVSKTYDSDVFVSKEGTFTKVRFNVKNGQGGGHWNLATFEMNKVWFDIFDPENDIK